MVSSNNLSIARACHCVGLPRSTYYRKSVDCTVRDADLIDELNKLAESDPGLGCDKYIDQLRLAGFGWNHKRIRRVYRALGLNHRVKVKRRLPKREPLPLIVPRTDNMIWSADFMADGLYHGQRIRLFNVIDDYNREALDIEVDTSLTAQRVIRVFERLEQIRGLPDILRVDNGSEFTSHDFTAWCQSKGIFIDFIEPGKPNQNAFIERFNRSLRTEVLDRYLFNSLTEVRLKTQAWLVRYNEIRPHESLGGLPPVIYAQQQENSRKDVSTK